MIRFLNPEVMGKPTADFNDIIKYIFAASMAYFSKIS